MKFYLTILLSFLLIPFVGFAATNSFTANGNITVTGVTFGNTTADLLIMDGSMAESLTFSSGAFTVSNPSSTFYVGSSDTTVKSIKASVGGSVAACAENSSAGTSYVTLTATAGTHTIEPSTSTDCTSNCTTLSNVATYNSFPTCGAATCDSGYRALNSGSDATCVPIGGGGIISGGGGGGGGSAFAPVPVFTVIPGTQETSSPVSQTTDGQTTSNVVQQSVVSQIQTAVSPVFTKTLKYGMTSNDVKRLQELLAQDKEIYPEGIVSGWFGQLTKKAVQNFQKKYGVISSGDEKTTGYGLLGPKTRTKLQEVFGNAVQEQTQTQTQTTTQPASAVEALQAQIQELLKQVEALQTQIQAAQ